jgi:predicted dehydrogenase
MYRAAVLGCGPRSYQHAAAYRGLDEISLVAVCDMNRERLDRYADEFGIGERFEDLETMLQKAQPDILHIVAPPLIREQPMHLAAAHGVKGIIVEKPLALTPSQAAEIAAIAAKSGMKVAVNTQRPYFTTSQGLKQVFDDGKIGDPVFIRCVTKGNILQMGTHMMDLVMFFLGGAAPDTVWACARGWNGEESGHPAPANVLARFTYRNGLVVYVEDADDCIGTLGETAYWMHFELDFWGTQGHAWWLQNRDWGYVYTGMEQPFSAPSRWETDEEPGQREFTRAMAHWLDDDAQVHINCLDKSLNQFNQIMGAMLSALTGEKVALPAQIDEDVMAQLEKKLKG